MARVSEVASTKILLACESFYTLTPLRFYTVMCPPVHVTAALD